MIGLGGFSAGTLAAGAGSPDAATVPPADAPELANYLNPTTGDYVLQEDGSNQRMPLQRHRVLMLVKTKRGSAAPLPDVGLALPVKMDQSFEQRTRGNVVMALEPIGDDIRIDAVPVERTGMGRADITVAFTDLTTGNAETVTI